MKSDYTTRMSRRLIALALLVVAFDLALLSPQAWAQVSCSTVSTDTTLDSDNDGFPDVTECDGIELNLGTATALSIIGDPAKKDLFVIYAPASTGSLLPPGFQPFGSVTAYGLTFSGGSALGVNVRQVNPDQVGADRKISSASAQKAVKITESLDTSGTVLGSCQWGTPNDMDGCVVYTQRAKNFIASTCGGLTIVKANGDVTTVDDVLHAYATWLILHETGHSSGGLTAQYDSRFGGFHYKSGSELVMEQAVTYSTKAGKCRWYISPTWNMTLDPPAVKLK